MKCVEKQCLSAARIAVLRIAREMDAAEFLHALTCLCVFRCLD